MADSPYSRYQRLIENCQISNDPAQAALVGELQELFMEVLEREEKGRGIVRLFSRRKSKTHAHGLYIWGGVGRGKSMAMDLFYEALPIEKKRRVHFHAFMLEVHAAIHRLRQDNPEGDHLADAAKEISDTVSVLCFDEFQVEDIGDAMILARLFAFLFSEGMVIIFTSNQPPDNLYENGLQRERFLPFIKLLTREVEVFHLDAARDYRTERLNALHSTYFTPLGLEADQFLNKTFGELSNYAIPRPSALNVKGHLIDIPAQWNKIAWFSFADLCEKPLGAEDYIELTKVYSIFLIGNIPQMTSEMRNEAKRFIHLIDVLYEAKAFMICTSEVLPDKLYAKNIIKLPFERTVSRLKEMMSADYAAPIKLS